MAIENFNVSNGSQNIDQNRCSAEHENELVSDYKSCIPQLLATTAVSLSAFSFGTLLGFSNIMIAELYDGKAGITMSLHELTWFSSYLFMEPVGSIISSVLLERVGDRSAILFSMFLYIIIWLMFYNAKSTIILLGTQALTGLLYLIPIIAASTYITGMSQPHLRSKLMAFAQIFEPSGMIFTNALSSFVDWRTITLVCLSFPAIAFVVIYFIPENPEWLSRMNPVHPFICITIIDIQTCHIKEVILLGKGRLVEMEIALAWLRGSKSPNSRKTNNAVNSSAIRQKNDIDDAMRNDQSKTVLKLYMQRSFYLPLLLAFVMFIIYNFSGLVTVSTYSIIIFAMIGSPVDEYMATTVLYTIGIVAHITCILIINYTGKRNLILISTINVGLSFLIFSLLIFFNVQKFPHGSMILVIMIMIGSFSGSVGFDSVIHMIYIELFPEECRIMGVGVVFMYNSILTAIVDKIFLYVVELITLQGVFLAFAFINFIGFVVFYFIVPDTDGISLREIEEHYANVHSLKHFSCIERKNICVNTDSNGDNLDGLHHI